MAGISRSFTIVTDVGARDLDDFVAVRRLADGVVGNALGAAASDGAEAGGGGVKGAAAGGSAEAGSTAVGPVTMGDVTGTVAGGETGAVSPGAIGAGVGSGAAAAGANSGSAAVCARVAAIGRVIETTSVIRAKRIMSSPLAPRSCVSASYAARTHIISSKSL